MNIKSFLLKTALIGGIVCSTYVNATPVPSVSNPSGAPFGTLILNTQTGPKCNTSGYKLDQYHMAWYADVHFKKIHYGEDWNGKCGGDTDENYPLRAIGTGKVVYFDNTGASGKGRQIYIRHSFPYTYAPSDVQTFDSVYMHINDIETNNVTWSGSGTGSIVRRGDIPLDGTVNGVPSNPYQRTLTIEHALRYRSPSLITDDRSTNRGYTAQSTNTWGIFTMGDTAPSSTAYFI